MSYHSELFHELGHDHFELSPAIQKILAGADIASVFGVPVSPILEKKDVEETYLFLTEHDERKPIVNVIRAAAASTIAQKLGGTKLRVELPPARDPVTDQTAYIYLARAWDSFDRVKPLSTELVASPRPESTFERILTALSPYYAISPEVVREKIIESIQMQPLMRELLPDYFALIREKYTTEHGTIPRIASQELDGEIFGRLIMASQNVMLDGAKGGYAHMHGYLNTTDRRGMHSHFDPQFYQLDLFPGGTLLVRLKDRPAEDVEKTEASLVHHSFYQSKPTGCPAKVRLIPTILRKAVQHH